MGEILVELGHLDAVDLARILAEPAATSSSTCATASST
jgi:hypothetical protein